MIITDAVSSPVVSNVLAAPSRFKIKASAKAFKILSGFYSEPILAIPRELGANAWDSHVKAGNTKQMFEVHAPNTLEPWFAVRDFGTGLSPEAIDTIYTTYFESTKTGDNDSDGCMGLGSKTPFNYTDNFNVTSWYNGKKYVYNCFIDETGSPNIMQVAVENTTDHNGIEVKFGVKIADVSMWVDKIRTAYEPFRFRPVIKGANITYPERTYIFSGEKWGLYKHGETRGSYAFMGNYCYPINVTTVLYTIKDNAIKNKLYAMLSHGSFDLYFNIGDLEVAPNKEQLQYDDTNNKTANAIVEALQNARPELEDLFKKSIETPNTLWEAMRMYSKYSSYNSPYKCITNIIGSIPIRFNNEPVDYSHHSFFNIKNMLTKNTVGSDISLYEYVDHRGKRKMKKCTGIFANHAVDTVFYYTTSRSVKKARVKYHIDNAVKVTNANHTVAYVIVDNTMNGAATQLLKNYYGWKNIHEVESLPKPPSSPRQKKTAVSNEALVADISDMISFVKEGKAVGRLDAHFHQTSATIDSANTYYYIDYMYSSPVWNNKKIDDVLQNTINLFVQNGLYGSETKIYGINKKNSGLMKVGKWINVFDVVKKNIFDANKAKYEDDFYKANQIEKINNLGSLHNIITKYNIISMIASKDTKNVLLNFIKEYSEIQTKNYNIDRNMMSTFGISPKKHTDMFDIDAFKNVLSTKYMNLFNIANFYSDNIKSLASIVNFIDEKS